MSEDLSNEDPSDGIIGCLPSVVDPAHVQELEKIVEHLPNLFISSPKENFIDIAFLRYSRLLHLYQEQPNLLDGLIPKLVEKLVGYVNLIGNDNKKFDDLSRESLKYIQELCTVRGNKIIVRLLPHQVSLLEKLLLSLEFYSSSSFADHSQRNVLLLWLWIVVRNPFDLRRFDPTGDPNNVITRIMNIALEYMKWDWNTSQYSASLVIAQCLSRTDGIPRITDYLSKLLDDIQLHENNRKFLLADLLLLLAILKHVDRTVLEKHIETIRERILFLYPIDEKRGTLICKCLVKVVQRIGLIALKPRSCRWSYRRGKRLLDDMLNDKSELEDVNSNSEGMEDHWNEEADMEHADIVEWSLEHVLTSLCNSDTSVRWSAAKGIGRITTRLPNAECATQVVDSIIAGHFGETGEYSSWHSHGACLALAELARRGVLLPSLLDTVIPAVENALSFEDFMGRHQNANQVRDAACYVVWAFARTYEPIVMGPYLQRLANALICVALFDREVNLRRAASAAFQEMAGRQKNVANGISLLTLVDYFAVTNRQRCFDDICVKVASFAAYSQNILDHLIRKKIVHWDEKIREQSALALEQISSVQMDHIDDNFYLKTLEKVIDECGLSTTIPIYRHGFLLAAGHLIKGLSSRGVVIDDSIMAKVVKLPNYIGVECNRLSHSGALIRKAVCVFIKLISESDGIQIKDSKAKDYWMSLLISFLKDTSEVTRNLSKSAMKSFIQRNLENEDGKIKQIQNMCLVSLSHCSDENERIGICMMCEVMPSKYIDDRVVEALCDTVLKPKPVDKKWAISRQRAIIAINSFGVNASKEQIDRLADICFDTLYRAMADYTTSAKGDIGRFVRESSMQAMTDLLIFGKLEDNTLNDHVLRCTKHMIQQSAERIGRTRQCACSCLKRLIDCEMTGKRIDHVDVLRNIYNDPYDFIQDNTVFRLKTILNLGEVYYEQLILGIVVSAGGLGEGTQKTAKQVLLEHQREINMNQTRMDLFLSTCAKLFRKAKTSVRIGNSFMQVLPQILGNLGIYEPLPDSSEALHDIIQIIKMTSVNSNQITRQRLSIDALAELLNCEKDNEIYRIARDLVLESLSSQTPVLRKAAAEKLYEHFCCAENIDEQTLELLSTTGWQDDSDSADLKHIVELISQRLD